MFGTNLNCRNPILVLALLAAVLVATVANAQFWSSDRQVTQPASSEDMPSAVNAKGIVAPSPYEVHIVYASKASATTGEVWYGKSTDQGITWEHSPVSATPGLSWFPAVDVPSSQQSVNVAWIEDEAGLGRGAVWYRRLPGAPIMLTQPGDLSAMQPAVAANNNNVVVVVWFKSTGNTLVRYRRSTDGGTTWGDELTLAGPWPFGVAPTAIDFGGDDDLHASLKVYVGGRIGTFYLRSLDAGASWGSIRELWSEAADCDYSGDGIGQETPTIAASASGRVDIAWVHGWLPTESPDVSLFAMTSGDRGATWPEPSGAVEVVPRQAMEIAQPCVVNDDREVAYLVWMDCAYQGQKEIYYSRSVGWDMGWSPRKRLTTSPASAEMPRVAVDGRNTLHLVFRDNRLGNSLLFGRWGLQLLSDRTDATAYNQQRHIARSGTGTAFVLHMAYMDQGNIFYTRSSDKGATWSLPEKVTAGEFPAIAVDPDAVGAEPRIAYVRDNQHIMCTFRDASGNWTSKTIFSGTPPVTWPGAPTLCHSANLANKLRVVYAVNEDPSGAMNPVETSIWFNEFDENVVDPPVVLEYLAGIKCRTPTITFSPNHPKDMIHVAWEVQDSIYYRVRNNNGVWLPNRVWVSRDQAGSAPPQPASSPFLEFYGDQLYCVWAGPNVTSPTPSEVWQKQHQVSLPPEHWVLLTNKSQTGSMSTYPVCTAFDGVLWQEDAPCQVYLRLGNELISQDTTAAFSRYVSSYACWDLSSGVWWMYWHDVWTNELRGDLSEVRFHRYQHVPTSPDIYSVSVGESIPSVHCMERDGYGEELSAPVDFGAERLRYRLSHLYPLRDYVLRVDLIQTSGRLSRCRVSIGSARSLELEVPSDTVKRFWLRVPRSAHALTTADVELHRLSGARVAIAGLAVCDADVAGGEGIQAAGSVGQPQAGLRDGPTIMTSGARVAFSVPRRERVKLSVFDLNGRLVRNLVDRVISPGSYSVEWDGADAEGVRLTDAVYFLRLEAAGTARSAKLVLCR